MTRRATGLRRGWREGGGEGEGEEEEEQEDSSARTCAVVRRRAKPFKFLKRGGGGGGGRDGKKRGGRRVRPATRKMGFVANACNVCSSSLSLSPFLSPPCPSSYLHKPSSPLARATPRSPHPSRRWQYIPSLPRFAQSFPPWCRPQPQR